MSKLLKLIGLLFGVTLANVILLSPGLLGVRIVGGSALEASFGLTVLFVSLVVILYGIYGELFKKIPTVQLKELKTNEDYVKALQNYQDIKVLREDIVFALGQELRLKKKKGGLTTLLNERFDKTELSYQKFASVVTEVEKLFYMNIRNILNKVSTFDETEYESVIGKKTSRFSKEILREKQELFNEYLSFVKNALNINEEILLYIDKLVLEISRLNNIDINDIDNMAAMQEMDALIKQTKLYKN
ncbi:hypothetical protein D1B31_15335 [Neobacillus notoginsengisoli]|uniref:5-bromo-4-chloroindolyl phosphate hydrolysis protein n=1 Tax=Neobacillus notoginsengisoli TaxID=1578198 RepID=A0A417YS66_9BACI|nr:hypothetical protein [Neobacillus notoginsengisoli]RHW38147.1 hypothetical protein D1B31_15335 [Neobacillus notoginsengisoli]